MNIHNESHIHINKQCICKSFKPVSRSNYIPKQKKNLYQPVHCVCPMKVVEKTDAYNA